ncbi:MAG: sensor domain-containing diguanylate cyclase [Calditrichaeota bacterium]|nr:sensor domain-containing diguanylate cyclase [Calditrichota bacterium]
MNKKKTTKFRRSIVQRITNELPGKTNTGKLNTSLINDLLRSFTTSFLKSDKPAELLIHVPENIDFSFQNSTNKSTVLEAGKLYLIKISTKKTNCIIIKEKEVLAKSNFLRRELLLYYFSDYLTTFICAFPESLGTMSDPANRIWSCFQSSDKSAIVASIQNTLNGLKTTLRGTNLNDWLISIKEKLRKKTDSDNNVDISSELIVSCSSAFNQFGKLREITFEETLLLKHIQEAVGWETEPEDLFNAIAKTAQKHLGYDYIELVYAKPENGGWLQGNVFKRNETDHGGDLLTLILKKESFNKILSGKQPILLNDHDISSEYMANPRLLSFMSLNSGVLIPLCNGGKANGILKVFSHETNHFRKDHLPTLEAIGGILAKTISNIITYSGLRRMATIDGLTNVFSRRFFSEHLIREYKRARRYRSTLSLIMIDIDYFKHYNDTNGHLAGDKVLIEVAKILKENVRGADLVARYGGEEFVVILPETGLTNSKTVADKMRAAVEANHFKNQIAQPGNNVTISLGIATLTPSVNSATALINLADIALYEAKDNGRNRCEVANELRNL